MADRTRSVPRHAKNLDPIEYLRIDAGNLKRQAEYLLRLIEFNDREALAVSSDPEVEKEIRDAMLTTRRLRRWFKRLAS